MQSARLHYFYDPFCGWCYAAAPMVSSAQSVPGLAIQAHGVGMLSGDDARWMSSDWGDFVRPHELRVTALTGQTFGDAYVNGVQMRTDVRLDSSVPIAAMIAAEDLSSRGIDMIKQLQARYYQQGRPISTNAEMGLDADCFAKAFAGVSGQDVSDHVVYSKAKLETLKANGFPVFALERGGHWEVLHLGRFLGRPEKFRTALEAMLFD
jgi:putative protein-disulfide isomerase